MATLVLLAVAATPLLVTPQTYELFEFPKMLFIYLVATLLLAKFAWGFSWQRAKRLSKEAFLPWGPFLASFLLSFAFSQNRLVSFWGYYTRFTGGFLSLIAYLIIFHATKKSCPRKSFLAKLTKAILASSLLVSLYGIGQHFGIDKSYWIQNVQLRVFSTIGQPNWLASYLLMTMPVSLFWFFRAERKQSLLFLLIFACQFLAFWFSYSFSGMFGFALLAFALAFKKGWLAPALERAEWQRKRALVAGAILLIGMAFPGPWGARLQEWKNIAQGEMQALASDGATTAKGGDTGKIRLLVWQGTVRLWLSSPKIFLIGSGPETFSFSFLPFRPAGLNNTSEWDFLYNRAHNEYLDILATQGLLGLASYLFLLVWGARQALQTGKEYLLLGIFAMSISLFFGFHTVITSLYLWIFLACVSGGDTVGTRRE